MGIYPGVLVLIDAVDPSDADLRILRNVKIRPRDDVAMLLFGPKEISENFRIMNLRF